MADEPQAPATFDPSSPKLPWWLKGEERQNFGDFLTDLLWEKLSLGPKIEADVFHLVGSVIADPNVQKELTERERWENGRIAYWGCGARSEYRLKPETLARCLFFGVRGPLTRDVLRLDPATVLGDPGLLVPLMFQPSRAAETRGRTICLPHMRDPRAEDELLRRTGVDMLVRPSVANTRPALLDILDKIASADFVLTGSLHGAIIACAFDVPFAYLDTGHLDVAFKWRDFAASIGIGTHFVDNLADARVVFEKLIAPRMVKPSLLSLLAVAPFHVRDGYLGLASIYDANEQARRGRFDLANAEAAARQLAAARTA